MKRTRSEAVHDKVAAVKAADESGEIADSMTVRLALIARVKAGEITLDEAKRQLALLRRTATKNGKTTRSRVWRRS